MLVAIAEQPAAVTPGTMQQNLLNPYNQIVQTEQEDGLQQKQEQQLTNIDLHAVNQGIDLLNKYYPGLGQVTFQPVQSSYYQLPLLLQECKKRSTHRMEMKINENQVNGVKQPDQSANQKLDDSEDNNKKDDKQTQTSKITHQQTISSLVER